MYLADYVKNDLVEAVSCMLRSLPYNKLECCMLMARIYVGLYNDDAPSFLLHYIQLKLLQENLWNTTFILLPVCHSSIEQDIVFHNCSFLGQLSLSNCRLFTLNL